MKVIDVLLDILEESGAGYINDDDVTLVIDGHFDRDFVADELEKRLKIKGKDEEGAECIR